MQVSRDELEAIAQNAWQEYHYGNKNILNDFYPGIIPFCLRVSSKTCGKYIEEFDEEASITRMAIFEAMEKYDPQKGGFLFYLARVVRNRTIDHQRREKQKPVPFSFLKNRFFLERDIGQGEIEDILDDLSRQEEIQRFSNMLGEFKINFKDLVGMAPKQQRTRGNALSIAWLIVKDEELCNRLFRSKTLPLKELESKYTINRKTADKYRKYIIAAVLILVNDFPLLKNYIEPSRKVKK
ncbi:MAG: sigma factor [Syntrophomonadaceae bacterium]